MNKHNNIGLKKNEWPKKEKFSNTETYRSGFVLSIKWSLFSINRTWSFGLSPSCRTEIRRFSCEDKGVKQDESKLIWRLAPLFYFTLLKSRHNILTWVLTFWGILLGKKKIDETRQDKTKEVTSQGREICKYRSILSYKQLNLVPNCFFGTIYQLQLIINTFHILHDTWNTLKDLGTNSSFSQLNTLLYLQIYTSVRKFSVVFVFCTATFLNNTHDYFLYRLLLGITCSIPFK